MTVSATSRSEPERVPTDIVALNYFACQYNRYGESLERGIVDVAQWKRIVQAWRRLTGA